uniref:Chromosome 11 open reading frame 52 n=1 Tax=Crocodylus porosus TaxID=8502 RepID=A0A7M4E8C4_CROPO
MWRRARLTCTNNTSLSDFRKCPSPFQRKKEKQGKDLTLFSTKAQVYTEVPEYPVYATVNKPKSTKRDDSVHYADIQVFTKARERSAEEVKNLQMQNATEYATLNFPRPRLKYDSKNGTLV